MPLLANRLMPIRSLEARLQLGMGIALSLLLLSLWYLAHESLYGVADEFTLSGLQHDAAALAAAFQIRPDGTPEIGPQRVTPVYNQPFSGHYFILLTEKGDRFQSRSLWDHDLETRQLTPGTHEVWHVDGPDGQNLKVLACGYRKDTEQFTLLVAEDISSLQEALQRFDLLLAGFALLGWLLLSFLQHRLVQHTFRQLQPVYRDIERLERGEAHALTEQVPSEVLPLVRQLNRLLELYQQRLERSRNAAGNLAHALKTPLSLMRQCLEHADLQPDLYHRLMDQWQQVKRLSERQLKQARIAGSVQPGKYFDPAQELPVLIDLMHRMHPKPELRIDFQIHGNRPLPADREDMLELLGNLLDNACKWADKQVVCQVDVDDNRLRLVIQDDGPGCDAEQLQQIQQRGVRLDENIIGHGLGLSICQDIVSLYRGEMRLGRATGLGGLRACVELPLRRRAKALPDQDASQTRLAMRPQSPSRR